MKPAQVLTTPMWLTTKYKVICVSKQSYSPIFINAASMFIIKAKNTYIKKAMFILKVTQFDSSEKKHG